jgi:hypothetical protein
VEQEHSLIGLSIGGFVASGLAGIELFAIEYVAFWRITKPGPFQVIGSKKKDFRVVPNQPISIARAD